MTTLDSIPRKATPSCIVFPDWLVAGGRLGSYKEWRQIASQGTADIYGRTLLILAAREGNNALVEDIACIAETNILNFRSKAVGHTALHQAALCPDDGKGYACAKILLEYGADPNICADKFCDNAEFSGESTLYLAVKYPPNKLLIKLLIENDAIYQSSIGNREIPLEIENGSVAVINKNWERTRLISLGCKDTNSPFANLPKELISLIFKKATFHPVYSTL